MRENPPPTFKEIVVADPPESTTTSKQPSHASLVDDPKSSWASTRTQASSLSILDDVVILEHSYDDVRTAFN